ncbi:MAG: hypothetical protein JW814_11515 [Candidatus Krumholzibacteriota bacterium]|nr:hypothetical protein [Candidatus Krumholzibacteriota bacterium]
MKSKKNYVDHVSIVLRRTFEGKLSPMNFLLILGFFSSLVMLYISLHVHFYSLSEKISEGEERVEMLREEKIYLTAEQDRLTSHERIIPIVQDLGFRAGYSSEINRVALYEDHRKFSNEAPFWAQAQAAGIGLSSPLFKPER